MLIVTQHGACGKLLALILTLNHQPICAIKYRSLQGPQPKKARCLLKAKHKGMVCVSVPSAAAAAALIHYVRIYGTDEQVACLERWCEDGSLETRRKPRKLWLPVPHESAKRDLQIYQKAKDRLPLSAQGKVVTRAVAATKRPPLRATAVVEPGPTSDAATPALDDRRAWPIDRMLIGPRLRELLAPVGTIGKLADMTKAQLLALVGIQQRDVGIIQTAIEEMKLYEDYWAQHGKPKPVATGEKPDEILLGQPIRGLDFRTRLDNALLRNDIKNIGQLIDREEVDLKGLRDFGTKSLDEIKAKLAALNLQLKAPA